MDSASDFISEVVNSTELPQTNETKPYMPGNGFTKVEGTNLANGLTIQDSDGNQYVWVEVPMTTTVYPTAGLNVTDFSTEEYTKIEDDLHSYTATYRNETDYADVYAEDSSEGWYTSEEYTEAKKKMLKSIYQNGGFWVARYEAGLTENRTAHIVPTITPQSKNDLYPYTYVTRTEAKNLAEMVAYTKGEKIYNGNLMFGIQWDLMLKFIETKNISINKKIIEILSLDSKEIGNYYDATFSINRGKYAKFGNLKTWYKYTEDLADIINSNIKLTQESNSNAILLTTGAAEQNV